MSIYEPRGHRAEPEPSFLRFFSIGVTSRAEPSRAWLGPTPNVNVSSNSDLCTNTRVDEKGFTARRDNFSLECLFNYFFIPRNRNFLYDLSRNLSYSYEKLFKFFWQKFAILQNFLLCLISPRWELSFDIHEAIVILDHFQKAILDEPEADLSDLEID